MVDLRGLNVRLDELVLRLETDPETWATYRVATAKLRHISSAVALRYREVPARGGWDSYLASVPSPEKILFDEDHCLPLEKFADPRLVQSFYAGRIDVLTLAAKLAPRGETRRIEQIGRHATLSTLITAGQRARMAELIPGLDSFDVWEVTGAHPGRFVNIVSTDPRVIVVATSDYASQASFFVEGPLVVVDGSSSFAPLMSRDSLFTVRNSTVCCATAPCGRIVSFDASK